MQDFLLIFDGKLLFPLWLDGAILSEIKKL
jgi:hypothetical protein